MTHPARGWRGWGLVSGAMDAVRGGGMTEDGYEIDP